MRTKFWLTVLVLAIFGAWQWSVLADDPQQPSGTGPQAATESGRHVHGEMIHRLSEIPGFYVYDGQNMKLGKLDNLIADAHSGQILYGILDTGLFGKNIPVPWAALQMKTVEDKHSFVLNKSKDELGTAPTLSATRRADYGNEQWRRSIDTFFGVRTAARPAMREGEAETQLPHESFICESSRLAGFNVFNAQKDKLGKVNDLVVDTSGAQVLYGIVDSGVGGKRIAVPWGAFRLGREADKDNYWLVLDKSKDQLATAPMFEASQWPDFANQEWRNSVDRFYGVRTASEPRSDEPR